MKWIGANVYRTSHYPYSEESMQFADEQGIMIIDECPSVDTEWVNTNMFLPTKIFWYIFFFRNYNQALLDKHKSSLQQLINRDKNHASVIMWSIANEPRTNQYNSDTYFGLVKQKFPKIFVLFSKISDLLQIILESWIRPDQSLLRSLYHQKMIKR